MPEGSNKKQHKSIKEEKHMKANQTKVKKERPYGQSFQERSVALAVLCAGCGADLYFQLHSHVRYSAGLPEVQCESRYPWKPVGRSLLLPEVFLITVFRNDDQEHADPESVWTARKWEWAALCSGNISVIPQGSCLLI